MISKPFLNPRPTDGGFAGGTIPLDIGVRIDELKLLKSGWLDGEGESLSSEGLDWFFKEFQKYYQADLPLPYLFPTLEGGLLAEWSLKPWSPSLEIDLERLKGEWHNLNIETKFEESIEFDLTKEEGWQLLALRLRRMTEEPK